MRPLIVARARARSAGALDEAWAQVTAAAERAPRVLDSLSHDPQPANDAQLMTRIAPAAVLVAILERPSGLSVLLTRRTIELSSHAGQISFPGGRAEPADPTPAATALREAQEEVGLEPARVELLGRLDNYLVGTGYRITPVVALVTPPKRFVCDPREVAEAFEVPLPFVLEAANYRRERVTVRQFTRRFHVLHYKEYYIWGATAAILVNLRKVLDQP